MAQIDTGSPAARGRATNHELPLVPFIDFLLCLVSFLLITAVWSQMAPCSTSRRESTCRTGDPRRCTSQPSWWPG